MKNKDPKVERKLDLLKHTRPRDPMPRPTVFKDKSKFDRNKEKIKTRKEKENY